MKRITVLMTCVFLSTMVFQSKAQERSIDELIQSYEINQNSPNNFTQFFTIEEMRQLNAYLKDQTTPEVIIQNLGVAILAYGWESQANGYGSYDISSPNTYTTISPGAPIADGDFEGAGAIDPNNNTTGYTADNVGNIYSLDVLTGTYALLGNTGLATGFTGLAYNPDDGVLYGVNSNNLYLVDPVAASATLVGSLGLPGDGGANPTGIAIALAIDGSGMGYTYDIVLDIAYSIDLGTGTTTSLGPIGFNASFGQGMFYDEVSDEVYLAAFNAAGNLSELRILDTTTGGTTLVGEISPGAVTQVGWSSVQNGPALEFPLPYCGPLVFNTVEPMTNVEFAGIANRSDATVGGTPAHEDFTGVSGDVLAGESYEIALEGNTVGEFTNRFAVFVDWNQNDVLDDAGEVYEITQTINGSDGNDGQQATQTLDVPIDALAGKTRMRVKKLFGTNDYLDPCVGASFGQAEDYSINVTLPTARVQVVHNSPDPAAEVVDVYLNGDLLLDDFAFRTATPFIDAPANTPITLDIAPGTSVDVSESIFTVSPTLAADETYIVVASGVLDSAFSLEVFAGAREAAAVAGNTDVLVQHGSPDAPTVDVVNQDGGGVLVDDISYPEFQGYLELPTADYLIDITTADGSTKVAGYQAYLAELGLADAAVTVFASGFLDPASNGDGPAFGLWVSLATGGPLVELNDEAFVPFPAPYCGPLDFTFDVEPITNVEFSNLSNRSDAAIGGSPTHEDFTSLTADVTAGESFDIVLEGNTGGAFENRFAVFIDWNQNDVLDDAGEVYEITTTINGSTGEDGQQAIQSLEIPAGQADGLYRMRVKKIFGEADYLDPCSGAGWGQAEDYTVSVGTLSNTRFDSTDFTYYPNPVNDILSISTASTVDNIKVYNMLGQMVVETAPKVSNPQVDMNELQSGVYLVTLEVEGSLQTFRVIKQ